MNNSNLDYGELPKILKQMSTGRLCIQIHTDIDSHDISQALHQISNSIEKLSNVIEEKGND